MPLEVLDILVLSVDDLSEFLAIHHLLEHIHPHFRVEVGEPGDIRSDDLRYGRTPAGKRKKSHRG